MARLSLHLLGSFQATLNNHPVKGFDSDRVRALLAYLAVEADRPHRRERLAGLLWPEQPEQTARSNLRYALSNLRRVIGDRTAAPPFLLITRHALQFNADSDCWIDVTAFTQHLPRQETPPNPETITQLEEAIALYRGDFLAGFSLSHSAPFEEWGLFTREKLTQQAAAVLRRLLYYYDQRGNIEAAQKHARHLLRLEPWREETHQILMRLLALNGQRSAALAQYQTCRQILAAEIGVDPLPETTGLYHRIRSGQLKKETGRPKTRPVAFSTAMLSPNPTAGRRPFVARDDELARLHRSLKTTLAGQSQTLFITGEAGSGKTTLIHHFVWQAMAQHKNLVVAYGICNAFTGLSDPYLPFREIIQTLTGDIETKRAGGDLNPEHARRLWAIWPEAIRILLDAGPDLIDLFVPGEVLAYRAETFLPTGQRAGIANRLAALAGRPTGPHEAQPQQNIFQQVIRVLRALAGHCPLVLVVDDLQWADNGSLDLLFHLSRNLAGCPVFIIGAYRPADVIGAGSDTRHPLPAIVNEIKRLFGDCHLDLNRADGRQLVEAYLDTEPNRLGDSFRETLLQQTGGNPLFTVELLDELQSNGVLVKDETGHWVEAAATNWQQLPARVEAVIAERIGRLPEAQQTLLQIAAVEGEEFTAEVAARIQEESPQRVIQTLSHRLGKRRHLVQSTRLEFLQPGGQRLSRYRFRHNLFQKYLYNQLDEPQRLHLHQAVGNALEQFYQAENAGDEISDIWSRLAYHFEAAGVAGKAIDYLLRAGNRAARMSANEEAIALFSKGLALLKTLPDTPEHAQQELELRLALGGPLMVIRGWGANERARVAAKAIELCQRGGNATQLLQALYLQADMQRAIGQHKESLAIAQQYLDLAQLSGDQVQIALAHWSLGETQFFLGELAAARANMEKAVALHNPYQNRALTALTGLDMSVVCLSWLSWTLWGLGYPQQALARGQEALTLARNLDQPVSMAFALAFAGCGLSHLSRQPQAARESLQAIAQLPGEEIVTMQPWSMVFQGWGCVARGHLEEGIAQLRGGLAAWQEIGAVSGVSYQSLLLVEAYGQNGQIEAGLELANQALAGIEQTNERLFEAELRRVKGALLLKTNGNARQNEAEACFLQAIETAQQQQAKMWELRATTSLARLWQQTGRGQKARPMLAGLYHRFTEGFDTPDLQAARMLLEAALHRH